MPEYHTTQLEPDKVLPFRQRAGPWLLQSALSRGANRLCSILTTYVLQEGARAGATKIFTIEKLRALLNRHRSQHERPVKKRTVERYLAEAIAAGFITRESSNRRRDRRAKATRGAWLRLHIPEHDSAQPTESKALAGKNGGTEPKPHEMADSVHEMADSVHEMADSVHEMAETVPRTLRDQERSKKGRRRGEQRGDSQQAEPDTSPEPADEVRGKEAEAIEERLVRFAKETLRVEHLPHDPPTDSRSRSYRVEHIAARLAEGYDEADLERGVFLACGNGYAFDKGIDLVKHAAKRLSNYLERDGGRMRADVFAEARIGARSE